MNAHKQIPCPACGERLPQSIVTDGNSRGTVTRMRIRCRKCRTQVCVSYTQTGDEIRNIVFH